MPIELKISICFFLIGISNVLLRGNRNWIFGYRSPRAIRTHKHYAYANTIYGAGMFLISGIYLVILIWLPSLYHSLSQTEHLLIAVTYFAVLFLLIEIKLRKVFNDNDK